MRSAPLLQTSVGTSRNACAGAAAAFLLRNMASKTGCSTYGYAERLLFDLTLPTSGGSVVRLARWFEHHGGNLRHVGLHVVARRVAFRTPWLLDWVEKGNGFRGAVLQTERFRLQSGRSLASAVDVSHAVALSVSHRGRKQRVSLTDPWPGHAPDQPVPDSLESAHRAAKYGAVVIHWTGWS